MEELSQESIQPLPGIARLAEVMMPRRGPTLSGSACSFRRDRGRTQIEVSARPLAQPLSAAGAVITAGVAYSSLSQGAFYSDQFVVLIAVSLAALGLELIRQLRVQQPGRAVPLTFGLIALSGIGFSSAIAGSLHAAMPTFGVILVVVVGLTVGSADRGVSEQVLNGLAGCALLVAATAWGGVAFHHGPWGLEIQGMWRGASAITYTNAAAALIAMMMVVFVARLCVAPSRAMRLVCYGLAVGLLVTMSRAGIAGSPRWSGE